MPATVIRPAHNGGAGRSTFPEGAETPVGTRTGLDSCLVRVDYTNGSAQIIDPTGLTIAIYGPGVTRHTLDGYLSPDRWHLTEDGAWTETYPPDGRQHPVIHRPPDRVVDAVGETLPAHESHAIPATSSPWPGVRTPLPNARRAAGRIEPPHTRPLHHTGGRMSEHRQRTYNGKSFSNAAWTTFHGRPECPACDEGRLQLWHLGMAYDIGGSVDGYDSAPPPAEPDGRYEATLMVCRDRYNDKPGCGFTLTAQGVNTVSLREMQAIADRAARETASQPDQNEDNPGDR